MAGVKGDRKEKNKVKSEKGVLIGSNLALLIDYCLFAEITNLKYSMDGTSARRGAPSPKEYSGPFD